jgi:hypothetical protein
MTPEKFWSRVDKTGDCWLWQGAHNNCGYGTLWLNGESVTAHRYSALLAGLVTDVFSPKDRTQTGFILHQCDNPGCVNPEHFKIGTYAENQREAYARGRRKGYQGAEHANAKLTEEQVQHIRKWYATGGVRQADIAAEYGVSQRAISLVVRGETYAGV